MKIINKLVLLLCLVIAPSTLAESFRVIVGLSKPPYVIQEQAGGFEIELIKEILHNMNLEAEFLFVPMGRSKRLLDHDMGDAILTANPHIIKDEKLLSDVYIIYQNVAITLKSSNLKIESLKDLSKNRVVAFQMANKLLGDAYSDAVLKNSNYMEIPNQFRQVKLLLEGRMQVAVMDINIFKYFFNLIGHDEMEEKVDIHHIFPKSPYQMAFKDPKHVKSFNQSLLAVRKSEFYQALLKKYRLESQDSLYVHY
jgi:polar amino acid transport system substrate-binding protein